MRNAGFFWCTALHTRQTICECRHCNILRICDTFQMCDTRYSDSASSLYLVKCMYNVLQNGDAVIHNKLVKHICTSATSRLYIWACWHVAVKDTESFASQFHTDQVITGWSPVFWLSGRILTNHLNFGYKLQKTTKKHNMYPFKQLESFQQPHLHSLV